MPLILEIIPGSFIASHLRKNRNATDDDIIKAYQKQQGFYLLLVRSPPMAGKTSLAQLLEQYLLRDDGVRAYTRLEHLRNDEKLLCDNVFRYILFISGMSQERWGSTNRATEAPKDLKTFLIDTFTVMDPQTLQNSFGVGKDKRFLERTWQMEFYRAATQ
ncbi:15_t:CDS:2, partial [Paraglomus occultum]